MGWQNPEDYAYLETLTPHKWAWEFLRRNGAYLEAWARYREAQSDQGRDRRNQALIQRLYETFAAARDFGLLSPCDPECSALREYPIWLGAVGTGFLSPQDPNTFTLTFRFTQPLEPQLQHAAKILRMCERAARDRGVRAAQPKIRFDRERFTLYLRLLDAKQAKESIGEMGRVLFKGKEDARRSAKGALRMAQMMVERGYRDLLFMADL